MNDGNLAGIEGGSAEQVDTVNPIISQDKVNSENQAENKVEAVTVPRQSLESSSSCDVLFDICTQPIFWYLGLFWLFGVVVTGAILVFLLIPGVCDVGSPIIGANLTDHEVMCRRFNNINVNVLLALFTLINLYNVPLRTARMYAVYKYGDKEGIDFRGNIVPTDQPRTLLQESYDPSTFYFMSYNMKLWISVSLLISTYAQYINQITRFVYPTFEMSNVMPGQFWVNFFFVMSFLFMGIGGYLEGSADAKVRKDYSEDKFKPIAPMVIVPKVIAAAKAALNTPWHVYCYYFVIITIVLFIVLVILFVFIELIIECTLWIK